MIELLLVLLVPVLAVGLGWLYGRNTRPPLVDPEDYERYDDKL